jgi:hypothetical protein
VSRSFPARAQGKADSARTHGSHTVAEDRDGLTGQPAGPGDPATDQGDPPGNARCCSVFRNGGPSLRVVDETLAVQVPGGEGAPREGASAGRGDEHERLGYRLYHAKIARRLFRWSGEGEV